MKKGKILIVVFILLVFSLNVIADQSSQVTDLMGGRPEFEPLFDPTSLKKSAGIGYGIDMPNVGNLPDETKNFFQCLDDSCSSRTQTGMQDAGKKIKSIIDSGGKVKKCDLVGCVMEPAGGSEVLVSYNDQVKSAEIIINGNVGEESYSVVSNSNLGFVKGESVSLERIVEHTWKASGTKEIHSVVVDDDGNIQEIITKSGKIVTKDDSEFQKMLTNWGNLEKGLNDYYSYGVDPKIIPAVSGPSYLPETFTDGSGDVWELQGDGTYKVYDQQLGTTLIGGLNEDGRMEVLFAKDENGQGAVGLIFDSATTTALPTLSQAERELQSAKSFEGIVEDTKRGLSFTDDNKVVDVLSGEVYYYEDGQWYRERNNWFDKTLDENDAKFLTASRNSYLASKNALGTRKELDKVVPQKLKVAATNDDSYNLRILSPEEREKTGYSYAYVSANSDGEKIIYLDGNKNFLAYSLDGGDTFKTKEDETIVPSLMAAMKLEEKSLKIELPKGKSSLKDNDAYLITALSALGYDISDPDKAIRAFQSDHELKDDGAAGENTLAALNADLVKNGLTKGVEVEEKTVTSNVDSATPLAGKVTAYQKEHLTPEIISAIESNGVAVVEDGKYSRDADGNIIFEGADGMILKIGKTEEETEELSEGESTIDFEEEETTVVTPKEVLDAKSGLPITEDKVFNVPAGAKTGKELFGTGAACKDCQYWKQGDKYYRYNPETGEVTEVLSTAKGYNTLTESNLPEVKVTPSQPKPNQPTSHEQEVKAKVNAVLKDLQARKITHGEASEMIEALAKEEEAYLKENSLWHETQLKVDNVLKQNGIAGKTVPETVTTFDLDNIGKGLNIQREPDMDDNAYRELINKKLGEINAYLDKDSKLYKDLMEKADSLYWQGDWLEAMGPEAYDILVSGDWSGGHIIGGIAGFAGQLGKYRALSNLLFPETTQDWLEWSNSEFLLNWADLPGFASREWCGYDEAKRYSEPGKSTAFVGTVSGTYQFVGSIQAEKSSYKIPISCKLNPNYDGMPSSDLVDVSMLSMPATGQAFYNTEDEWICNNEQVCKDDGFCYLTEKSEEPVKGYYYKITWGVSAPTDEKFTPYVDENGKAVKFNLKLFGNDQKWVFKRQGAFGTSVIALNNGAQDSGTIVSYLAEDYYQVCIVFDSNYKVSDYENDVVKDICTNFLDVSTGYVDYNGDVDSIVSSSSGVSVNI